MELVDAGVADMEVGVVGVGVVVGEGQVELDDFLGLRSGVGSLVHCFFFPVTIAVTRFMLIGLWSRDSFD